MIKKVKDLNIGSYVLSYNTETNEYEYKKISAMQNQGVRQVYLYITKSGRTLRCTDNHKVVQIDESGNFYEEQIKNVEYLLDVDLNKDYIVSIEKFEECEVIDAEVEDNHNFVTADGNLVRNSRAGSQTPFSSINYGTGTTGEQRLVIKNVLLATDTGLGHHETPIFPVQIFKVKDGISGNPNDPNYDLFKLTCIVSAKRLFPNFSFIDAPFNLQYYKEGNVNTEAAYMGCRTRVLGNHYDPTKEIVTGRGNLSFTSINLPRLAILSEGNTELFFEKLKGMVELVFDQLLERFKVQCKKKVKNYPSLMGQGIWIDSDKLGPEDSVEEVLKHGSLTVGFIGLAECLKSLTGFHHGESEESQQLGLEIIGFMREMCDKKSEETGLNFTLIGTPAEGLSGRFVRMDKERFGIIEGVTDREYYTNSFHVPVYYNISAKDKILKEAPYHALTNGGHICYVEVDGDPTKNVEAFEDIVQFMKKSGVGYGAINHPVDYCPNCGYTGIIDDKCPRCGNDGIHDIPLSKLKELQKIHPDIIIPSDCCQ